MYCAKCQNHISECTCGDMDERLASLNGSKHFVYRKCLKCGKHYDRCKCKNPEWGLSNQKIKEQQ